MQNIENTDTCQYLKDLRDTFDGKVNSARQAFLEMQDICVFKDWVIQDLEKQLSEGGNLDLHHKTTVVILKNKLEDLREQCRAKNEIIGVFQKRLLRYKAELKKLVGEQAYKGILSRCQS